MLPQKVLNFLKKEKILPKILKHKKVYTAFDKSQTLKVSPSIVVKTLILKLNKELAIFLLPADKTLDLAKIKKNFSQVSLLKEKEIQKKFKGVKIGAIPPFGKLWKIPVFGEKTLKNRKKLIVSGGNWQVSLEVTPKILEKLAFQFQWTKIATK